MKLTFLFPLIFITGLIACSDESIGVSNNNPGNIIHTKSNKWFGEIYPQTNGEKRFVQFSSSVFGIRAIAKILLNYSTKKSKNGTRIDTVQEIIERWAPPIENNTNNYAKVVRRHLGLKRGQKIKIRDKKILFELIISIIKMENGYQPYSDITIRYAIDKALGSK